MMRYYSLNDEQKEPRIGKLYRLVVDGEEAIPIIVTDIRVRRGRDNTEVIYSWLHDPEYEQEDTLKVFCHWYGEW